MITYNKQLQRSTIKTVNVGKLYQIVDMKLVPAHQRSSLISLGFIPGQTFLVEYLSNRRDLVHITTRWGDSYGLSLSQIAQLGIKELLA